MAQRDIAERRDSLQMHPCCTMLMNRNFLFVFSRVLWYMMWNKSASLWEKTFAQDMAILVHQTSCSSGPI